MISFVDGMSSVRTRPAVAVSDGLRYMLALHACLSLPFRLHVECSILAMGHNHIVEKSICRAV